MKASESSPDGRCHKVKVAATGPRSYPFAGRSGGIINGNMKRFLVLGIGPAQVDLLRALRGHFESHALSHTADGPGRSLADHFARIDITDRQAVSDYASRQAVDFVYSIGSDVAMPTACRVSERLGLPRFVASEAADWCQNKVAMRQRLRDLPGSLPFQRVTRADDTVRLPFPLMMKPADSQGQRGVIRVESEPDYRAAFDSTLRHSRSGQVILERLIEGVEVSAHAWIRRGELVWSLISDRVSWPGVPGGVIHKHTLPTSLGADARAKVRDLVAAVTKRLEIWEGPAYFQIKVEGGIPYLIEVAPRLDGCHLWRLIRAAGGPDLLAMTLSALTTGKAMPDENVTTSGVWTLEFFSAPPGTVFRSGDFSVRPDATHIEWYRDEESLVPASNGHMEKCGYQIYREPS